MAGLALAVNQDVALHAFITDRSVGGRAFQASAIIALMADSTHSGFREGDFAQDTGCGIC